MIKLYTYQNCPYCQKVRDAFAEMGIQYEEVDAERGTPGSEHLMAVGGKQQVPFLEDLENNVHMYESDHIIAYAKEHYAGGAA